MMVGQYMYQNPGEDPRFEYFAEDWTPEGMR